MGLVRHSEGSRGRGDADVALVNSDAYSEGNIRVSVTLHLVDCQDGGDTRIRLKRQHQAKQEITSPTADRDFEQHLDVDVGGNILPEHPI